MLYYFLKLYSEFLVSLDVITGGRLFQHNLTQIPSLRNHHSNFFIKPAGFEIGQRR
jgi:hypothetical protein